jgi:hypothetical protein
MSRLVARAESWEKAYEAFQNINFAAFDYNTVKQSMLDYVKLYFPESFNDFIETSEFVAILELFAYLAELVAYRLDINAHENFLSTAQRKDSVLRLAKLISYKASRNSCARGLVKVVSISTSEHIFDNVGTDLSNQYVRWNDRNNQNWKEQFLLVLNRVMEQPFGSVKPSDRKQIDNVLFELYSFNNNTIDGGIFPFAASVSNKSYPMELVPVYMDDMGPRERRPEKGAKFTFLYGNDGLGDGSDTTGFFFLTKQGTLQRTSAVFDGITPNQVYNLAITNINDTDVWVNQIDPLTGLIVDQASLTTGQKRSALLGRTGEWDEVDLSNAQNIVFNTHPNRKKYEIETLNNDAIRVIFGDGEFADIPSGLFEFWVRSSANEDIVVPRSSVVEQSASFTYQDDVGRTQTCTFTFSLTSNLTNAAASEDIEHVRTTAPSVYYTQDRMVNGRDYNQFMLQDPSILKLRSVNRTYAGDSKYIAWHDPSTTYENAKIFGDDLTLYFSNSFTTEVIDGWEDLVGTYIEPKLAMMEVVNRLVNEGAYRSDSGQLTISKVRTTFTDTERNQMISILTTADTETADITMFIYYNKEEQTWVPERLALVSVPDSYIGYPLFVVSQSPYDPTKIVLQYAVTKLIANSEDVKFWNTNLGQRTITYDTLKSNGDWITALKANDSRIINLDKERGIVKLERNLSQNWNFEVLGQEVYPTGLSDAGLRNIHELVVVPQDVNKDGVADYQTVDMPTSELFDVKITIPKDIIGNVLMPINWIKGASETSTLVCSQQLTQATEQQKVVYINKWMYRVGLNTLFTFINGVYQTPRSVLERTTSSIQFTDNAAFFEGDNIELINLSNGSIRNNVANITYREGEIPSDGIVPLGFTYQPGENKLLLFVNGIKQVEGSDYEEISSTQIKLVSPSEIYFSSGVIEFDELEVPHQIVEITAVDLTVTEDNNVGYTRQMVLADTVDMMINLPIMYVPGTNSLLVFVNGVKQPVGMMNGYEELTSTSIIVHASSTEPLHTNDIIEVYVVIDPNSSNLVLSDDLIVDVRGGAIVEDIQALPGTPINILTVMSNPAGMDIIIKEYAYFERTTPFDRWVPRSATKENMRLWLRDKLLYGEKTPESLWKRERGRSEINFVWLHRTPRYHLVDPSPSNIIDTFIISRGYYLDIRKWLEGRTSVVPVAPTPGELRTSYGYMLDNKMISDTVILHPGVFKLIFGNKATAPLQAKLKVIRAATKLLSDNQLKTKIVNVVREYFDVDKWEFGETFYFTELATAIHSQLSTEIDSVVLVPVSSSNQFGDLFQVKAREDEIIYPDIDIDDIDVVDTFTAVNIRLAPEISNLIR